ncbi:probable carboxylesterase 15 [Phtheirospermum japonicum]|uniref:Probable carboxylesterase 15 n=1 Tax=Phtheirospermum japonicum TaxID=374723 RepID=A0A830DA90_9LAMI|nr:probable carboxylesterase 15 [Phtheirospermum japonicum]
MKVEDDGSAVWNDCLYDENNNLHLRLYKPCSPPAATKLPVLYFFHGGGFCLGSRTWPHMYSCCLRLASALQVLVVAPDYHLAPGHRLPAALGDDMSSVQWLQNQAVLDGGADEWLQGGSVNFGRVLLFFSIQFCCLSLTLSPCMRPFSIKLGKKMDKNKIGLCNTPLPHGPIHCPSQL